jgi:hypothetical protein
MAYCNRTSVSNSFKTRLLDDKGNVTKHDLFEEVRCRKKAVSDGACYDCLSKEENNKKIHKIDGHKLYDVNGTRIWQPRVIHRKGDEPLPLWSQIRDGEWHKSMLKKGFRDVVDMPPKKKEEQKTDKSVKRIYKKKEINTSNVVVELKPKMYVDTTESEIAYELVKVELKPLKIQGVQYYYEQNKNKVYTTDFSYVGRYDVKSELLCTDYPDSDAEPSFT